MGLGNVVVSLVGRYTLITCLAFVIELTSPLFNAVAYIAHAVEPCWSSQPESWKQTASYIGLVQMRWKLSSRPCHCLLPCKRHTKTKETLELCKPKAKLPLDKAATAVMFFYLHTNMKYIVVLGSQIVTFLTVTGIQYACSPFCTQLSPFRGERQILLKNYRKLKQ